MDFDKARCANSIKRLDCNLEINNESAFNNCDYLPNKYILKYWQPKTSLDKGISTTIDEMNYD
jgi:hypothetical protein